MGSHIPVLFPPNIARGAVGGATWNTTIVGNPDKIEQRNQSQTQQRAEWTVGQLGKNDSETADLIAFFNIVQGMTYSFQFKDWSDFTVGMSWVADVLTYTGVHNFAVGNGAQTVFQLLKVYTYSGYTRQREIYKPVSAIRVYVNNVLLSTGYSVDYTTGLVTFTSPPGAGIAVGWAGQYYNCVRLGTDKLLLSHHAPGVAEWQSIPIVEVANEV